MRRFTRDTPTEIKALTAEHKELARKFSQWRKKAEPVWHAIEESLQAEAPDLSGVDWPEPDEGDEDPEPLFNSWRTFVEQMNVYKEHQGKPTSRKVQGR